MKTKNKKFCLNVRFLFKRLCCVAILCLLLFAPACSENKEDKISKQSKNKLELCISLGTHSSFNLY